MCVLTTVFDPDPDVEPSKEHRQIFESYKKLVSEFSCFVGPVTCITLRQCRSVVRTI